MRVWGLSAALFNALCLLMVMSVYSRLPMTAAFASVSQKLVAADIQYQGNGHKNTRIRSDISEVIDDGPVPISEREFIVNGWRWHTMSVLRDLSRFRAVVGSLQSKFKEKHKKSLDGHLSENELLNVQLQQVNKVISCFDFVCGFNWKALIKVETKIFFPWLRELLPKHVDYLLSDYGTEHKYIEKRFLIMQGRCLAYETKLKKRESGSKSGSGTTEEQTAVFLEHLAFLYHVDEMLVDMQQAALRVQSLQQGVFVPFVAAYVKTKTQEAFNNKVVTNLGLLDSQIHLVSMCDAISHDDVERNLWKLQIPKIARSVLPLWRKRLYRPRTKNCFEIGRD